MIIIQVAIITLTWYRGFSFAGGGLEYNIALIAMCLALIYLGSGVYSVDRMWRSKAVDSATHPSDLEAEV
jgi:uncharacterized membrane protein YphA (DoxX/SURF4 family)